jgi:hypothetical protein
MRYGGKAQGTGPRPAGRHPPLGGICNAAKCISSNKIEAELQIPLSAGSLLGGIFITTLRRYVVMSYPEPRT